MGLLKTLTGNDAIKASRKGEHEIDFVSICKIWFYGNYKPVVREMGNSFWRRDKLIPFNATVPDDKINLNLPAALQEELPGILNWAIAGCLLWQREGFVKCKAVTDATKKYREESDELALFIRDACELGTGKDYFIAKKAMKDAYCNWCEDSGQNQIHTSDFIRQLTDKGVTDGMKDNKRGWWGIKVIYAIPKPEGKTEEEQATLEDENGEPNF
jgi:putative DNA primase/helicase